MQHLVFSVVRNPHSKTILSMDGFASDLSRHTVTGKGRKGKSHEVGAFPSRQTAVNLTALVKRTLDVQGGSPQTIKDATVVFRWVLKKVRAMTDTPEFLEDEKVRPRQETKSEMKTRCAGLPLILSQ